MNSDKCLLGFSPVPSLSLPALFLPALLQLLSLPLSAQEHTLPVSFLERTDFKVGYFGNFTTNHGLNLSAEYLWKEKVRIRERRKGLRTVKRQLLLNGALGYSTSFVTRTQNGVFAYSGLTLRRVSPKSREFTIELNPLGLYRSVLPATYEVNGNDVRRVFLPGRLYYGPSVAIGIGRFRRATKRSGWYLSLQYTLLTNYNVSGLPITSVHFGRKF